LADEENSEGQNTPQAQSGGGSKKSSMVLILLVVVSTAAVVFNGVMMYMNTKKHEGAPKTVEELEGKVGHGNAEGGEHGEGEHGEEELETIGKTIPMETFLVNLSGSRGRSLAKVDMEFEVDGDRVADEIEKRKPQIRDIVIILLSSKTYAEIEKTEGKNALRDEIRDTVNAFLTKGKIKRVLFTNLIFNR